MNVFSKIGEVFWLRTFRLITTVINLDNVADTEDDLPPLESWPNIGSQQNDRAYSAHVKLEAPNHMG